MPFSCIHNIFSQINTHQWFRTFLWILRCDCSWCRRFYVGQNLAYDWLMIFSLARTAAGILFTSTTPSLQVPLSNLHSTSTTLYHLEIVTPKHHVYVLHDLDSLSGPAILSEHNAFLAPLKPLEPLDLETVDYISQKKRPNNELHWQTVIVDRGQISL